jgi:hypothetical protein
LLQLGQWNDLAQQRLSRLHKLRCELLYLLAKPFELSTLHCGYSSRGSRTNSTIAKTPQAIPPTGLALGLAESMGLGGRSDAG